MFCFLDPDGKMDGWSLEEPNCICLISAFSFLVQERALLFYCELHKDFFLFAND